jgi:transcriptional regulator with XRE-family HTH domain
MELNKHMEMMTFDLGRYIRLIRVKRNISMTQLAREIESLCTGQIRVQERTVSNWEKGGTPSKKFREPLKQFISQNQQYCA